LGKLKKIKEKPEFFDLLLKLHKNCIFDFVNDSDKNFIDMGHVYYVGEVSNFKEENRDASVDTEDDSDGDLDILN
jgi:hypothetical protein